MTYAIKTIARNEAVKEGTDEDLRRANPSPSPFSNIIRHNDPSLMSAEDLAYAKRLNFAAAFFDTVHWSTHAQLEWIDETHAHRSEEERHKIKTAFFPLAMSRSRLAVAQGPHAALIGEPVDVERARNQVILSRAFVAVYEAHVGYCLETGDKLSNHQKVERFEALDRIKKKDPKTYELIGVGAKEHVTTGFSDLSSFAYTRHNEMCEDSRNCMMKIRQEDIRAKGQDKARRAFLASERRQAGRERSR